MSTTCETVLDDLTAYADGELPPDARGHVDEHVRSCLPCRHALADLEKVNAAVRMLPRVEPSADFAARLWERLDAADAAAGAGFRLRRWAAPALAAAALLALALRFMIGGAGRDTPSVARVTEPAPVVLAKPVTTAGSRRETEAGTPQVAVADGAEPAPEDLPPELLEQPELFLRLPVVRRLDTLENFEEVRHHHEAEPVGGILRPDAVG